MRKFVIKDGVLVEYRGKKGNVIIPNKVISIGSYAFYHCTSLTSVTIPDSVTSIGNRAFYNCIGLTSIVIPDSVTSIGKCAFEDCSNLTSVTIGNGLTSIGDDAFLYCSNLTSVTIGNSVTSIGYEAFYGCRSLTGIIIPDSVKSIGEYAFDGCSSLISKKGNYKAVGISNGKFRSKYNRDYEYKIGEWLKEYDEVIPCKQGYHFCDNLFNIFNYYHGEIDKDIAIFECDVGDIIVPYEDKFVTNNIKLKRRLTRQEIVNILNNKTDIS